MYRTVLNTVLIVLILSIGTCLYWQLFAIFFLPLFWGVFFCSTSLGSNLSGPLATHLSSSRIPSLQYLVSLIQTTWRRWRWWSIQHFNGRQQQWWKVEKSTKLLTVLWSELKRKKKLKDTFCHRIKTHTINLTQPLSTIICFEEHNLYIFGFVLDVKLGSLVLAELSGCFQLAVIASC